MPNYIIPERGVRREDIVAAREALWQQRTDDGAYSRMGDVHARRPHPGDRGDDLWDYGFAKAGWWIKARLDGVVFRPLLAAVKRTDLEEGGVYTYDYTKGEILLVYGSSYGVPARISRIPVDFGIHYARFMDDRSDW